jgi:hypothetical protein
LRSADRLHAGVDEREELADESGLSDPGNTNDRHELCRPLVAHPSEDRAQQLELVLAADKRCLRRAADLRPEARYRV